MSGVSHHVLVVEDDHFAGELAQEWLESAGFGITVVASGREAEGILTDDHPFDLVVLDLGLPGLDGLEVLRRVRAAGSDVGVIVVTGRGSEPERIKGLREGADDYLVKPFSPGELLARVEAVLRRTSRRRRGALVFDGLAVDLDARTVRVDGDLVELTRTEFDLLAALVTRAGHVQSKASLVSAVWNTTPSPSSFALLNEYVSRLRKRCVPTRISTVRGVGYRFDP